MHATPHSEPSSHAPGRHSGEPGGFSAYAFWKARRSLTAPKTKAQAERRASLYERVAQYSGNGPVARIAGLEAKRNAAVAAGGKYGRGQTPGRADDEKHRADSAYRQDVKARGKAEAKPETRQKPAKPAYAYASDVQRRLAEADKAHADASRKAMDASDAATASRRAGMKASAKTDRRGLDAVTAARPKLDAAKDKAMSDLREARAHLDAIKERARLSTITPEQARARADGVMNRRLAQLDAGIKAKKEQYAARQAANDAERKALDVGPAIGADEPAMGRKTAPKRKGAKPVVPFRKADTPKPSSLYARYAKRAASANERDFGFTFEFQKSDATGRYVRGWASVIEVDGNPVVDTQGDRIDMVELRKAAHDFVTNARAAKAMHDGDPIGDVVESVLIDDDFAKAQGISHGKRGWWIGMDVRDESVRKQVREGKLKAFSIGGSGRRTPAQ